MTDQRSVAEPSVGQRLLDEQGVHWLVQSVTRSKDLLGFYIVRLAFGDDDRCEKDVWVLGRREYEALWRKRKLRSTVSQSDAPS